MSRHSRKRKKHNINVKNVILITLCLFCACAGGVLWYAALSGPAATTTAAASTTSAEEYRPTVGEPPYRVGVDAGHGGTDPGASGIVQESDLTAATAEALTKWLEQDANFIPLQTRESYDAAAKPAERAEYLNAQEPDLLLSIHANSAPEGSDASGFECYPTVPGRTYHEDSFYFAKLLASAMGSAGAHLRGNGGVRYIYYLESGEKQLVETTHSEVRTERSFTLLEDVNCPAVLAEQCFVTSESDVDMFGDADGCARVARIYYEAICAYFGTEPLSE